MILLRISSFRQFFCSANNLNKLLKAKCYSSVPKSDSKKSAKEIKDLVINQKKFDSNQTDLKKPVLLYANEKSGFYRKLFILNVCQTFFWIYLANVGIAIILKKPKKSSTEQEVTNQFESVEGFFSKLKFLWNQNSNQLLISIAILICGQISMSLFTLFTIRSVRYIILSPGAQKVRITTFSMTGSPHRYRHYDIPVEHVSAFQYRTAGGNYIPLKVKGKWFYFLVDSNGQFYKPTLFDQTVGVFRVLK